MVNSINFGKAKLTKIWLKSPQDQKLVVKWFSQHGNLMHEARILAKANQDLVIAAFPGAEYYQIQQVI